MVEGRDHVLLAVQGLGSGLSLLGGGEGNETESTAAVGLSVAEDDLRDMLEWVLLAEHRDFVGLDVSGVANTYSVGDLTVLLESSAQSLIGGVPRETSVSSNNVSKVNTRIEEVISRKTYPTKSLDMMNILV